MPEVRELVERVRNETAERILAGIAPNGAAPLLRAAVRGWMWFMDGAILDWLEHRDIDRAQAARPPARHAPRRGHRERRAAQSLTRITKIARSSRWWSGSNAATASSTAPATASAEPPAAASTAASSRSSPKRSPECPRASTTPSV